MKKHRPTLWFLATLAVIAVVTLFGPPERTLGVNVRVVYLHGAWVWAALAGLAAAGITGAIGLATGRAGFHDWSQALGRTGLFFWITYLPISLWAMQTNWNGLFLAEPRWRVALIFGLGGLAIQIAAAFFREAELTSFANVVFIAGLAYVLSRTEQVMHPPSPIFDSDVARIQVFFILLTALVMLAAWQMARMWRQYSR
jgi:hypothetical protein